MRLRNIPESGEYFRNSPYTVTEPETLKGRWRSLFSGAAALNHIPLEAEFGCGKGLFITALSAFCPETRYIGIDKYTSVIYKGLRHLEGKPFRNNLRFACLYASSLADIFADGELDRIYLNFPDPWPKKRHTHRRLTSRRYLAIYEQILADGGSIEFKTDNHELFEWSLEEFDACGWNTKALTFDLHDYYKKHKCCAIDFVNSLPIPDNAAYPDDPLTRVRIMTEYEKRFSSEGKAICKAVITPP